MMLCPPVCPSITSRCSIKTVKCNITQTTRYDDDDDDDDDSSGMKTDGNSFLFSAKTNFIVSCTFVTKCSIICSETCIVSVYVVFLSHVAIAITDYVRMLYV